MFKLKYLGIMFDVMYQQGSALKVSDTMTSVHIDLKVSGLMLLKLMVSRGREAVNFPDQPDLLDLLDLFVQNDP